MFWKILLEVNQYMVNETNISIMERKPSKFNLTY